MPDKQTELARSIEAIVGGDYIEEDSALKIDGLKPALIVRPGSADEAASCLRVCSAYEAAIVPAGKMTWLDCGNPISRVDVVLSLDRMNRIVEYSPPDLTATVEAGLTLSNFNAASTRERQWLPLDPPGFRSASLGAIAACNSSGALRLGLGTPRDYVIGLKLAHADGTQSKSGGRVVKNVAGYDMNKLYVGSFGTVAVITEIIFKLRPLPERSSTMLVTSRNRDLLFSLAHRISSSELLPASLFLARRLSPGSSFFPGDALLIRFLDTEAAVEYQLHWIARSVDDNYQASVLGDDEAEAVWAEVADFDRHPIRVRLSVPLLAVPAECEKALAAYPECAATADLGTGIIRLAFDAEEDCADQIRQLRANAVASGGSLIIEKAPANIRREVDAWGEVGSTGALMRSIKEKFDPQSVLNPGKFVLGI